MATGHSAKVTMRLLIEGHPLAVSQSGPDMLILTEPATLPACEGEFELTIDATTRRWPASIAAQPQASRELKVQFGPLLDWVQVEKWFNPANGCSFEKYRSENYPGVTKMIRTRAGDVLPYYFADGDRTKKFATVTEAATWREICRVQGDLDEC